MGMSNSIFGSSKYQPDYTPTLEFYNTIFQDVEHDAMSNLKAPLNSWANPTDCGNFPCTGPMNVLYSF
jgi:hypothetical protein